MITFNLGSETISVEFVEGLALRTGTKGQALIDENRIEVDIALNEEQRQVTLFEEIIHTIISRLGRDELNDDHTFITPFAVLMAQAMDTVTSFNGSESEEGV